MFANSAIFPSIPCTNLEVARDFYGGVLGLEEVERPRPADWIALFANGKGTYLFVYERPSPSKADHTVVGFVVDDVDAAADYLLEHGVTLQVYPGMEGVEWDERGVATMDGQKGAWFTDPDGNVLALESSDAMP